VIKAILRLIRRRPVPDHHPVLYEYPVVPAWAAQVATLSDEAQRQLTLIRVDEYATVRIEDYSRILSI
jgi:hypothetical protein